MSEAIQFLNGRVFDGEHLLEDQALTICDGTVISDIKGEDATQIDLHGDILAPGFVDLQVNGGGGINLNDDPCVETLRRMTEAHRALGATTLLPTLITDRPEKVSVAIEAACEACADHVPGIAGLHLEGPHLDRAKHGAHDPAMIRPMDASDLALLIEAAKRLPCLMVTLAPENATLEQVRKLSDAGVVVMLGHSDCDAVTASAYFEAGARGVTHLFNAMSQMNARAPGLVGAALSHRVWCGLIADGVHVAPEAMRVALAANDHIVLVSDAMAVAGTDLPSFMLGERKVYRKNNELRLEDETLAGADLDLTRAVSIVMTECGQSLEQALRRATSGPASLAGLTGGIGSLRPGDPFRAVRLREETGGLRLIDVFG
ncbi:N-acetylglucosamine-6-phosphate deacetylase [Roseivivax sp. THAF40]|uniref:N-acetylglucosamine-6-phosphate deacetylase n=1 Tax=unclassified Roseivivax TaxID=2639302 RepID=UPI0012678C78|nr:MULTISPECIES: N-acetylglucosamine-6-phosphate deacetylase [unclassified Roseivivax]QFS82495.1 N-acetylglucosamine-6-phosphate deacetylase [Roseivivax sp. THAF197b]QFT46264.1 N-acetylglucosamine-6-phosphate deacetylase [Roseivivax sp. THAF40]